MPELIDKDALRYIESDKDAYTEDWNDDYERGFCDAINKALKLPTIEAEPVRHRRWILDHHGVVVCNLCRYPQQIGAKDFCGKCGARMDADEIAERRAAMDDYAEY